MTKTLVDVLQTLDDHLARGLITQQEWTEAYREEWQACKAQRYAEADRIRCFCDQYTWRNARPGRPAALGNVEHTVLDEDCRYFDSEDA
jgi:hypothetical protein